MQTASEIARLRNLAEQSDLTARQSQDNAYLLKQEADRLKVQAEQERADALLARQMLEQVFE